MHGNIDRKRFRSINVVNFSSKLILLIKNQNEKFVVEFGLRKITTRQYTTVGSIPKQAIKNCSNGEFQKVNIQLVIENGEKYLKLTPHFELEKVF